MAFGNNLKQADVQPFPNNYCGGFAMSAVMSDFLNQDTDPIAVYNEIQNFQERVSQTLQSLIQEKQLNRTNISLPSSLVFYAQVKGFVAKLKYSRLLQFPVDAIAAEINLCGAETVEYVESEYILHQFSDMEVKYYLVLVNNCHWIAVKQITLEDSLFVYDPATGENKQFDNVQSMLQDWARFYENAGAVIITLHR